MKIRKSRRELGREIHKREAQRGAVRRVCLFAPTLALTKRKAHPETVSERCLYLFKVSDAFIDLQGFIQFFRLKNKNASATEKNLCQPAD